VEGSKVSGKKPRLTKISFPLTNSCAMKPATASIAKRALFNSFVAISLKEAASFGLKPRGSNPEHTSNQFWENWTRINFLQAEQRTYVAWVIIVFQVFARKDFPSLQSTKQLECTNRNGQYFEKNWWCCTNLVEMTNGGTNVTIRGSEKRVKTERSFREKKTNHCNENETMNEINRVALRMDFNLDTYQQAWQHDRV